MRHRAPTRGHQARRASAASRTVALARSASEDARRLLPPRVPTLVSPIGRSSRRIKTDPLSDGYTADFPLYRRPNRTRQQSRHLICAAVDLRSAKPDAPGRLLPHERTRQPASGHMIAWRDKRSSAVHRSSRDSGAAAGRPLQQSRPLELGFMEAVARRGRGRRQGAKQSWPPGPSTRVRALRSTYVLISATPSPGTPRP